MRIAIFSDAFPPQIDGVANTAYHSARDLAERGHEVHVFTVAPKDKLSASRYAADGFSITLIPSVAATAYQGYRLAIPTAAWFNDLRKFRPDVIHSHTLFGVGLAAVAGAKVLGAPLVGTHHTFYDHYLKHVKLDYAWMKAFSWKYTVGYYNRCALVIIPSQSLADIMIEKGLKRPVAILPNYIDTDSFKPVTGPRERQKAKREIGVAGPSVVYMGRLGYEKNIDDAMRAFAVAHRQKSDSTFVIVGSGPEQKTLVALAANLGVEKSVMFLGFREGSALVQALQANDLFVTASRSENMPLSVLEAMATGLPIVTVREKGLGEIIREDVNGLFAKTGDADDMARQIVRILSQPALQKKLAAGSRSLSLAYSKNAIMERLEAIYQKLVATRRPTAIQIRR